MASINIRKARPSDCSQIVTLIKELQIHAGVPDWDIFDAKILEKDGFGDEPFFRCLVAESNDETNKHVIGYALYYFTYSSTVGRSSFIEDLYVCKDFRGKGIGKKLWQACVQDALDNNCYRSELDCRVTNVSAYEFYCKFGAQNVTKEENLSRMSLDHNTMINFVKD